MPSQTLKLKIELVPKESWNRSLHDRMPRSAWDRLRRQVFADQGNVCAICRAEEPLSCHEVWEYDDVSHVQKLVGFQGVCHLCHHLTHFGNAKLLAAQGHVDLNAVVDHFMKVNGVDRKVFESHREMAFRIWRERSKHGWQTDLGEWAAQVMPETV
jgi:hypothetical protein